MSEARKISDETSHPVTADAPPTQELMTEPAAQARGEQSSWEQFIWNDATLDIKSADVVEAEVAEALPRIVSPQSASIPADAPESQEEWRRQFISALKEVDGDAPIPAPAAIRAAAGPVVRADDPCDQERRPLAYTRRTEMLPLAAAPRRVGRAVAGGLLALGLFATGALWAKHTPEAVDNRDLQTASIAGVVPKADPPVDQVLTEQPMVNTPVLVREGEAPPPPPLPDTSAWRRPPAAAAVPPAPRPETSAPVPPVVVQRTVTVHTVPVYRAPPLARPDLQSSGATAVPPTDGAPYDRANPAEAATRPMRQPAPQVRPNTRSTSSLAPNAGQRDTGHHAAAHHEAARATPQRPDTQPVAEAPQSPAPTTTQSASRAKWERRQGLKTAPPPEPSTLKKLLSVVWPGASTTTSPPANSTTPSPPAASEAPAAPPHDWSSKSGADP